MIQANPVEGLVGRVPEPGLESLLTAIRLGLVPAHAATRVLASWPLLVLDANDSTRLDPLLLRAVDGTTLVAAFTSPDRVGAHSDASRRLRPLAGSLLARGTRTGVGIVVNPGSEPSIVVSPEVVATIPKPSLLDLTAIPGSRALTSLESAIALANAGLVDRAAVRATAPEAELILFSLTDPAEGALDVAFGSAAGDMQLLAWTGPALAHTLERRGWAIETVGHDISTFLKVATDVVINPGTGLQFTLPGRAFQTVPTH